MSRDAEVAVNTGSRHFGVAVYDFFRAPKMVAGASASKPEPSCYATRPEVVIISNLDDQRAGPIRTENAMRIGLFIPCYVDQFYPDVGLATVEVLKNHGVEIQFPRQQTCCGQPMANTGCREETRPLAEKFLEIFRDFPYIVCPSGSCVAMVRHHYHDYLDGQPGFEELCDKTYELCEFLTDVLKIDQIEGHFPHRVGIHQSCHALRHLRLASSSERVGPTYSKMRQLLQALDGISFSELQRPDECCGFGGTFAINEEAVSCSMGLDRIADHQRAGTQVLTAPDMSCLMHMSGLLQRQHIPLHVMHIAQILAGRQVPST